MQFYTSYPERQHQGSIPGIPTYLGKRHVIPNDVLSTIPVPAPFAAPRTGVRFSAQSGLSDQHYGGIALADASRGITYQVWTATIEGANINLSAPAAQPFTVLSGVNAAWVALAFDQNAREFIAYADGLGNASYYWYDSTIPGFRTSTLTGPIFQVFAALDDSRAVESTNSDILLCYVRSGTLYMRAQRDRYGTEYNLGLVPGIDHTAQLVQVGMNLNWRFQFAFQNVQQAGLAPAEWNVALGGNEPA